MADITICTNVDCAMQDTCWRLNAPPKKFHQSYQLFVFDDEAFEKDSNYQCDYYIDQTLQVF